MYFYDYKLQCVCSVNGAFQSIELAKANVHDVAFFPDMNSHTDFVINGDKGYLTSSIQLDLLHTANIKLETPMRSIKKLMSNRPGYSERQEKVWKPCIHSSATTS